MRLMRQMKLAPALFGMACALVFLSVQSAAAVEFNVSGHINRLIRFADDGTDTNSQFLDDDSSESRLRFTIGGELEGPDSYGDRERDSIDDSYESSYDSSVGSFGSVDRRYFYWRAVMELGFNDPDQFIGLNESENDFDTQTRRAAITVGGAFGRLTLGREDMSTRQLVRTDLGNTGLADMNDIRRYAGIELRDMGSFSGLRFQDIYTNFDGDRTEMIRYDAPTLAGFTLSTAAADDQWDAALRYAGEFGGIRIAAGAQGQKIESDGSNPSIEAYGATASIMHTPTGLFAVGSYNESDLGITGREDPSGYFLKGGYAFGPDNRTGVSISYGETEDLSNNGIDGDKFTVGFQHRLDKASMDLYANYTQLGGDINGTDLDDVDVVIIGARIGF